MSMIAFGNLSGDHGWVGTRAERLGLALSAGMSGSIFIETDFPAVFRLMGARWEVISLKGSTVVSGHPPESKTGAEIADIAADFIATPDDINHDYAALCTSTSDGYIQGRIYYWNHALEEFRTLQVEVTSDEFKPSNYAAVKVTQTAPADDSETIPPGTRNLYVSNLSIDATGAEYCVIAFGTDVGDAETHLAAGGEVIRVNSERKIGVPAGAGAVAWNAAAGTPKLSITYGV